ncbi:hypothetical protein MLD38_004971 [Melastoma candidum]|nr:hypothetical protein MLD38_004971 [Melastoma candidum]
MVDDAMCILGYMEAEGCVPDLILCNVLMHGLVRNGRYEDAIGVFASMAGRRLVPDPYTFSSLFSAICLSRKFHILPNLVGNHVINADRRVFNSMLTYFCKANLPSLAVRLYGKMMMGLTPDKFSFVGLLNGLSGSGDSEEVINVYSNILTSRSVLDTHAHTVVMQALIQVGKCDEAMHLFRQAEKSTLDSISYAVAMRGLFKGGRHREVAALYDQMKESGIYPDLHVYYVMIAGYCKNKDEKMAMQILQDMVDAGVDLSCVNVVKISSRLNNFGSGCGLLIDATDLGLVPSLAAGTTLSSDMVVHAEVLGVPYSDHYQSFLEEDSIVGASSSEETFDLIAVG